MTTSRIPPPPTTPARSPGGTGAAPAQDAQPAPAEPSDALQATAGEEKPAEFERDVAHDAFGLKGIKDKSPLYQVRVLEANKRFRQRMGEILKDDPELRRRVSDGSLSRRSDDPLAPGAVPIDPEKGKEIVDATVDYYKNVPVGELSPQMQEGVKKVFGTIGIDVDVNSHKSIRDLEKETGNIVGKKALEWTEGLRKDNPKLFYSAATAVAGGVVAYGASAGSEGLKDIGLAPRGGTDFFGGKLEVDAEAYWEKGFKNFGVGGRVRAHVGKALFDAEFKPEGTMLRRVAVHTPLPDLTDRLSANVHASHDFETEITRVGMDMQTRSGWAFSVAGAHDKEGEVSATAGVSFRW